VPAPATTVHVFIFAQSLLVAQLVLQVRVAASHPYGVQGMIVPCLHIPAMQVDAGCIRSFPSQLPAPQIVPSAIGQHVP